MTKANAPLANATPTITTVQHIDYTKSLQFALASVDAFNKSGVSMVAACMVVMLAGAYGAERTVKYDEIKTTLETNLKKKGLGPTQVSKYIGYAVEACRKLFKAEQFGGTIGKVLVAADIDTAHKACLAHLNTVTKHKNTLEAVGVYLDKIKPEGASGHANQPGSNDVIEGKATAEEQRKAKRRETALKTINADPAALKSAPETVLKAAEVIGFATMVKRHVDTMTDAKALLAFKKAVDLMVEAQLKALSVKASPSKGATKRTRKATKAKAGDVQSEQVEAKSA